MGEKNKLHDLEKIKDKKIINKNNNNKQVKQKEGIK